jgi:PAS domain S-box-containing protein
VGVATAETLRQSMRSRDFLRLRRVEEVMARQMVTATAQETVISLVQRMVERRVSCVVIVEAGAGEGQRPIGIVTERDVVQMRNLELNLERLTAAAVMSTPLEWITPEQSLWDIQQAMERLRVRRLVVVEQDCLVGIVTQTSILNALDPVEMYHTIELLQAELDQLKHERLAMLSQQNADLQDQVLFAEQRFQAIFNNTFQFIGLMTPDGTLIEANQAALDFGGVTRDQVLHRPVWETYWWTISPETQEQVRQATAQAAQGEFVRYEVDVLGARGRIVTIDFSLRPLRDEHGNVVLLLPEGRDITELKQTQQALEFQVKFDRLVASLSNQFIQITPETLDEAITAALRSIGEFTQVDTCYIFRYDEQQLLHSMTHEWVSPSIESSQQRCQDLPLAMFPWATEQLQRGEIVHIPNTETLPPAAAVDQRSLQQFGVRSTLSLPLKQHDCVIGLVGFACFQQHRDWTDDNVQLLKSFADVLANALQRQQADIELRRSYQRYDNLVNRFPVGVYKFCMLVDGGMQFEYVSARWCDMNQLDASAVLQDASLPFGQIHPDERDNFQQLNQQARSTLQPFVWEGRMVIGGQVYWRHIESSPTQRDNGDIIWDGIQYDITEAVEAKQAQERLLAEAIAARIEVQQSEQRYASLAAAAPVGIFRTDADGNCSYVNDRWSQIAGMSRSDALGEGWVNGLHPDDREQISSEWYRAAQENRSFKLEYRFQRADGSVSWVFGQAVAERDSTGQIISYVGTITDITDRKRAETALQESEERLRLALTAANQGLYDLNLQTGDAIVSPEYATMLGYDPATFQETNARWIERLHPDDREPVAQVYRDYVAGLIPEYQVEFRQQTRSGDWRWILSLGKIVAWDEAGNPLRMLGTHTDINDRKLAELRLTLQNSVLARIAKADPLPEILDTLVRGSEMKMSSGICSILLCDREGRVHYGAAPHLPDTYNQAIEGLMTGEGKGSCGTAAFRRELVIVADIATDPLWQDDAALALAHGLRACWSLPVLASDGTVLATFAVYHHDIHYPEPQEILVIQRMADLTKIAIESEQSRQALRQLNQELEIKVIERTAALQESEAQLRDLFDNATDLIQSIAPDGRILFVNQAWKTALGYKESEIKQLSIYQVIHPDEVEHYRLVMQRLFDGEECEGIETRFVTKAGQEIILEGNVNCRRQDGQAVSTRGILRNVTERRQAEVQLKRQLAAIEAAVDGIAILQGDQYIYVNSSHLSLFGYSCSEDLIGKSWQCLYSPEEILRFEQEVFPVLGTHGRWEGEAVARRKDGTTFVEGLSMTLSEDGLLICVCRDITELKEAELQLQRVNADLQRSNQELEQFAYIASHDLQEPLRAISGYTQLLKQEYVEALSAPMAQEYMGFVMDGAQRMRLLIQDLLAYSRVGSRPLNLSKPRLG